MRKKTQVSWTDKEIDFLNRLVLNGMSARMIKRSHLIPRHTLAGINDKMSELRLGNPTHRQRIKNANRIGKDRRMGISDFLRKEGMKLPSVEAAKLLGISQQMVGYYRQKHCLELPNEIRFTSVQFRRSHAHVLERLNEGLRNSREKFWAERKKKMIEQLARDASKHALSYMKCRTCGEKWPATRRYFYVGKKLEPGKWKLVPHCRACGRALWGKRLAS